MGRTLTLKGAKKKAWDTFSRYIRERDKKCVCCGSTDGLQAGHFYHNVLDLDEMNVNAECRRCNHYLSGNLAVYATYLIRKYGQEKFLDLERRKNLALKGEKHDIPYFLAKIKEYEDKLKNL